MAYRTLLEEVPGGLKRVVLGTFDVRGRARRLDGVVYYLATSVIGWLLATLIVAASMDTRTMLIAVPATILLCQVPLPAWAIRRAHDYGVTGLVFVPLIAAAIILAAAGELVGFGARGQSVANILVTIGFLCALLWNPNEGANRFGANPRVKPASVAIG